MVPAAKAFPALSVLNEMSPDVAALPPYVQVSIFFPLLELSADGHGSKAVVAG